MTGGINIIWFPMDPQVKRCIVDAVFNIDVESFKTLLEHECYDPGLMAHVFPDDPESVPLHFIPLFWDCVLHNLMEQYEQPDARNVRIRYWRNMWLMEIMKDELLVEFPPLEFKTSRRLFQGVSKNHAYLDLFGHTPRDLHDNRHWEIDLDLYYAVEHMNLKNARSLLKKGANPWFDTPGMHDNCFNVVDFESSPLVNRLGGIIFGERHVDATAENVGTLEKLALYYQMRKLLVEFKDNEAE